MLKHSVKKHTSEDVVIMSLSKLGLNMGEERVQLLKQNVKLIVSWHLT